MGNAPPHVEMAMTDREREALAVAVSLAIHNTVMPSSMTTGERIEVRRLMKVAAGDAIRTLGTPV